MSKKTKQLKVEVQKPKLKAMWLSNSLFTSSGYGTHSRTVLTRMKKAGYEVAMQSNYGVNGGTVEHEGIKIYPQFGSPWGEDAFLTHSKEFGSHVNFTCIDIFPLNIQVIRQVPNWIPMMFVDGDPLSPMNKDRLNLASEIISVSKFGQKTLVKNGYSSTYIPLSVDTKVFSPKDKSEARKRFGLPEDVFIFGMVAANKDNPSRKSFQEVIDAFAKVAPKFPQARLFIHTNLIDTAHGFPIVEYASYKGLQGKLIMLDAHTMQHKLTREDMAYLYSSFDVLLNPSNREGFGLSIIEAQACGVPVLVNDCQSMPELVGAGKVCKIGWNQWVLATYQPHPDVKDLTDKMIEFIDEQPKKFNLWKKKAREFILNNYDSDLVFEKYWVPYLKRLEKRYVK